MLSCRCWLDDCKIVYATGRHVINLPSFYSSSIHYISVVVTPAPPPVKSRIKPENIIAVLIDEVSAAILNRSSTLNVIINRCRNRCSLLPDQWRLLRVGDGSREHSLGRHLLIYLHRLLMRFRNRTQTQRPTVQPPRASVCCCSSSSYGQELMLSHTVLVDLAKLLTCGFRNAMIALYNCRSDLRADTPCEMKAAAAGIAERQRSNNISGCTAHIRLHNNIIIQL